MSHRENILKKHRISVRTAVLSVGQVLLGIIFSYTGFGRIKPFGVAYSSVSCIFGAIGSIIGYIINGQDVFRYCIAAAVNCAARLFLWNVVPIANEFKAFLFTMWAFLAAGISGIFISENTFESNCLFIVGGIAGGVAAFMLSVASDSLNNKRRFTSAVRFVFINICLSAALTGIYSMGIFFKHTAVICAYFLLYCVCSKFGLYISATTASLTGLLFFITDPYLLPFLASAVIGTVIAGLLRGLGKYAVILSFGLSTSLMTVISGGDIGIFELLPDVIFAGIIYAIVPMSLKKTITESVSSGISDGSRKKTIKRKIKSVIPSKANETFGQVCEGCKKKILCWVRDYSATVDVFNSLRTAQKTGNDPVLPEHFKKKCERYPEILRAVKSESTLKENKINQSKIHADSASASTPKQGESICGDTCVSFVAEDGRQVYFIADGMGTGANAGQQSFRIAALLKKLLSQGLDKNDALKIINETLLKNTDESVMGLDIAILCEQNGICEFIKAGAAPSYIIRKGTVYEIGSSTLPIGILDDITPGRSKCMLLKGDVVIMISDGLISHNGNWIKEILSDVETEKLDPICLAGFINEEAKRAGLTDKDDISVIVIYLR